MSSSIGLLKLSVQVWKLGWSPQPGGEFGTTLPEIPVDFLQEKDVFREFLYRINTLGTQYSMFLFFISLFYVRLSTIMAYQSLLGSVFNDT